jgi:hypothetical protein
MGKPCISLAADVSTEKAEFAGRSPLGDIDDPLTDAGTAGQSTIHPMARTEATPESVAGRDSFIESLMDTDLYSMGAFFSDQHPDLVEEVVRRSVAIEEQGLESYADAEGMSVEEGFRTLLTGLAVRYYKAVAG